MRRTAGLYLIAGALLALTGPQAAAAPPAPAKAPALTGTVTLSGSESGFVRVIVPKETSLGDPFVDKHRNAITVTGGGVAAGFALIEESLTRTTIVGGHSAGFAEAYVPRAGEAVINLDLEAKRTADSALIVPKGSYRLYLVTGGKPTTVTLRFGGLSGASRLKPTQRTVSSSQGGPLTASAPGPVGVVHSGGYETRLTTPFVQFWFNRVDAAAHTETVNRICLFKGKPTGPMPYGPACATPDGLGVNVGFSATTVHSDEVVGDEQYFSYGVTRLSTADPAKPVSDVFGGGASVTSPASLITRTDYGQFWFELNAAPAATVPAKQAPAAAVGQPPQAPPADDDAPAPVRKAAATTLPSTGPNPALAVAPVLLLAAAAAHRTRQQH